eukprot:TRINITY_DN3402_c0_g1_i2.p1 TRINITY_DN3402_c0_g1~~TRINITY_DN3402_c0_g1_i2.p1  ORF type:complete len:1567 (-),score=495.35 TRINITY_DN3402_c0_g1_i2:56-4756(-)
MKRHPVERLSSVAFGFYTTEEIHAISVAKITREVARDTLNNPVSNGLADPRLGPTRRNDQACSTCGLPDRGCPGHFGHIDLVTPVYHPLLTKMLMKVLDIQCWKCHKFRYHKSKVKEFAQLIQLADEGKLTSSSFFDEILDIKRELNKPYALSVDMSRYLKEELKHTVDRESDNLTLKQRNKIVDLFFSTGKELKTCQNCGFDKLTTKYTDGVSILRIFESIPTEKFLLKTPDNILLSVRRKGYATNRQVLSVVEIREQMRSLWKNETLILDLIFGSLQKTENGFERKSSPEMFFIEAVLVPPNCFRPPNIVAGRVSDAPQNFLLSKIIENNNLLSETETDNSMFPEFLTRLQKAVSALHSNKPTPAQPSVPPGVIQILEKKAGLFRKHIMGKRVNFAARTVLSPDVNLQTNEIGIPLYFAMTLSFPEPVTETNLKEMQLAVENGPGIWPGANAVEDEKGRVHYLRAGDATSRAALSKTLRTFHSHTPFAIKKVYRHVRHGDIVLLNRQPTLHKPSIMGHYVRVLKVEKTLRLHYANCATYNADFDGDEMNIHLPQNYIAKAEAEEIANADHQYLGPRNGQPLRGLIQDHVIGGVLLTQKDTFFTREKFCQVVYAALQELNSDVPIQIPPPAVMCMKTIRTGKGKGKTKRILLSQWTGKQVITTILNQITTGRGTMNLDSKAKVPADYWGKDSLEDNVVIRDNELLIGVLDKAQFGASAYGLVHAAYELFSPQIAGLLLSILGKLFSYCLMLFGFTCSMDDMVFDVKSDKARTRMINTTHDIGVEVAGKFFDRPVTDTKEIERDLEKILRNPKERERMDSLMKVALNKASSDIVKTCFPSGQIKPFPKNNMALMTISGAKGSNVNFTQISCLLGQQELEGKRVPMMLSGKTLPCFDAFDPSARAGGYIANRFLTGIKPQEYFFHCMAGREGLIDTAVKTSRSGYLQRCIIKHLEGIKIEYDHTVRDSDGSVLQFYYGEDGIDLLKTSYLQKFDFHNSNSNHLLDKYKAMLLDENLDKKKAIRAARKGNYTDDTLLNMYDPSKYVGSVSEKFKDSLDKFIESNPDVDARRFRMLMNFNYISSMAAPGEPVGTLAGQSIGEPSTQMTLNTFHLAGRGDVNVTLGIPRLKELIAASAAKTPSMILPLRENTKQAAEMLAKRMSRIPLSELLLHIAVTESLVLGEFGNRQSYKMELLLKPPKGEKTAISKADISKILRQQFIQALDRTVAKELKAKYQNLVKRKTKASQDDDNVDEEPENKSNNQEEQEGTSYSKRKKLNTEISAYDEGDEDDEEIKKREDKQEEDEPTEDNEGDLKPNTEDGDDEEDSENMKMVNDDLRLRVLELEAVEVTEDEQGRINLNATISVAINAKRKLFMVDLIDRTVKNLTINNIPKINRCSVSKQTIRGKKAWCVQTEGINMNYVFHHQDIVDVNMMRCNDIREMQTIFGVEAARAAFVEEMSVVFQTYGIGVDTRHIGLIADYMMFEGSFRPMTRMTFRHHSSPFQRMSFESMGVGLIESAMFGRKDDLKSPSAKLTLGRVVENGANMIEVLHDFNFSGVKEEEIQEGEE